MAFEYQGFASLGVNLNRQKYGPLDISNVFTSEADLKYYLSKGTFTEGVSTYWYKDDVNKVVPYPYEGQVLATVINGVVNVYALALDAEGNFTTQEIAGKIEVDNKTIKLNDEGKLEFVGLPTDTAGKTYVPSYVNGILTWAEPDTSTVDGQQQAIDGLDTRVTSIETTLNGKAAVGEEGTDDYKPAVEGLISKVAANTQSIADTKTYTDTEIAGLTVAIEKKNDIEYIVVKNKAGEEIAAADASKFVQDSFLNDVAYNAETGKVTFTWIMGDGSSKTDEIDIAHLVDTYTAGNGLNVNENNVFSVDTTIIATTDALNAVRDIAEAAQTADEVIDAINTKITEANLGQYAKASEVETALADKVNTSELADYATTTAVATTYATKQALNEAAGAITDTLASYLTKDTAANTYEKIGTAYTKDEINNKIGAPGVPAIKDEATGEIITPAVVGTGVYQHIYSKDEITALIADITGGESAADVLAALNAYKTTNDASVDALEDTAKELDTAIKAVQGSITTLTDKDTELAGLIQGNAENFKNYYTSTQVDEKVQEVIKPYAKTTDVAQAINAVNDNLNLKANSADVYTKTEADTAFMTSDEVAAQINTLIAAADPDEGKTIANIQNLVKYVDENAGEIAKLLTDVADNTTAINAINDTIGAMVLPKESSEISIATDGVLSIKAVNVNKLVQTEGDVLVLNGGKSA